MVLVVIRDGASAKVMEHMGDSDFNDPPAAPGGAAADVRPPPRGSTEPKRCTVCSRRGVLRASASDGSVFQFNAAGVVKAAASRP